MGAELGAARTDAVRRLLDGGVEGQAAADLLFLEQWEEHPVFGPGTLLRIRQLHLAQPALVTAVQAEVANRARPGR